MEAYIVDENRVVNVYLYGIDGEERTEEFFDKYLEQVNGITKILDEYRMRMKLQRTVVYAISRGADYSLLVHTFSKLQTAIDAIADEFVYAEDEQRVIEKYTIDNCNYII